MCDTYGICDALTIENHKSIVEKTEYVGSSTIRALRKRRFQLCPQAPSGGFQFSDFRTLRTTPVLLFLAAWPKVWKVRKFCTQTMFFMSEIGNKINTRFPRMEMITFKVDFGRFVAAWPPNGYDFWKVRKILHKSYVFDIWIRRNHPPIYTV